MISTDGLNEGIVLKKDGNKKITTILDRDYGKLYFFVKNKKDKSCCCQGALVRYYLEKKKGRFCFEKYRVIRVAFKIDEKKSPFFSSCF